MEIQLKHYIEKYRVYLFPLMIIIISTFVLSQIFIPQIFLILDSRNQIEKKEFEVTRLNESLSIIEKIADETLDKNLSLVNNALPSEEDIALVYQGLSTASQRANISLDSFSIGSPLTIDKENEKQPLQSQSNALVLSVEISGENAQDLIQYIYELYKTFPLAEVRNIFLVQDGTMRIEVAFYYKPFNKALLSDIESIGKLSAEQEKLLNTLQEWTQ